MKPTSFAMLAPLMCLALLGCSGPSSEELAHIQEECVKFHKTQRAKYSSTVKAIDHWQKDGHTVVELSQKESDYSSSYTSHLCVYDPDKGSISLPSVFERSRWSK